MGLFQNLFLLMITVGIISIGYVSLPKQPIRIISYQPTCVKMDQPHSYLCAYCQSDWFENKQNDQKILSIKSASDIKILGIKMRNDLSCSEFMQLIDYDNGDTKQLQYEKIKPIKDIMQKIQSSEITYNRINNLFINFQSYSSIVIYQKTKFATMQTAIHQIKYDSLNHNLGYYLPLFYIIVLLVLIYYNAQVNLFKSTSLLNLTVLVLIIFTTKSNEFFREDQFQYISILFFVICLLKVKTKSFVIAIVASIMIFSVLIKNQELNVISYILSLLLFMLNGFSEIYIWLSMCVYIGAHAYKMRGDQTENQFYTLCKMIEIVILTTTTTFIQTFDDIIIKQYVQNTQAGKVQSEGFEMLKQDEIADEQG